MASPGFPARKSQGSGAMTSPGSTTVLDGPPPSPALAQAGGGLAPGQGVPPTPSFSDMAQPLTPGTPGRALAPDVAMGVMEAASTIYGMLDSLAGIVPDLATDFALQKDLLQRTMAKLFVNNGQTASPNATGNNFPGGGFMNGAQ